MSFWKSLFGGGSSESEAKASAPVEYNGFTIRAAPYKSEGQYQTAGIIELAQRLHDEHVAEGKSQRDQLIADAKAQASKILSDAEQKSREEAARLERERSVLESKIAELHDFERSYRTQLRSYIEGQLRDLDEKGGPGGDASAQ